MNRKLKTLRLPPQQIYSPCLRFQCRKIRPKKRTQTTCYSTDVTQQKNPVQEFSSKYPEVLQLTSESYSGMKAGKTRQKLRWNFQKQLLSNPYKIQAEQYKNPIHSSFFANTESLSEEAHICSFIVFVPLYTSQYKQIFILSVVHVTECVSNIA